MKVADIYRCEFSQMVLTGEGGVNPFVVVRPGVEIQHSVTGVVPLVGDETFVGHNFLKVEVAAGERACTAVGNRQAVAGNQA